MSFPDWSFHVLDNKAHTFVLAEQVQVCIYLGGRIRYVVKRFKFIIPVRHFHQTVTHFKCFVQVDFIVG